MKPFRFFANFDEPPSIVIPTSLRIGLYILKLRMLLRFETNLYTETQVSYLTSTTAITILPNDPPRVTRITFQWAIGNTGAVEPKEHVLYQHPDWEDRSQIRPYKKTR